MSAEAAFAALRVTAALERSARGAAVVEIHLLAYLACVLSVYTGRPATQWRYDFAATPSGAPYSHQLNSEIEQLRAAGLLLDAGNVLILSDPGNIVLAQLAGLTSLGERAACLDAACSAATMQPLASLSDTLAQEPQLHAALGRRSTRELFTGVGLQLLEKHFDALRSVAGTAPFDGPDLLTPTAVWLAYLAERSRSRAERLVP